MSRNISVTAKFLPPETKLGQGNIFRSVCQEFCSHPGAVHAGRYGQQAGGTHPTGMHTCAVCVKFITSEHGFMFVAPGSATYVG